MTSLSHLNKLKEITIFFTIIISNFAFAADPVDIWKKKENQTNQISDEKEITIKSPILSDDVNKITIKIDEQKINNSAQSLIGIFDPEDNNFSLNMWAESDGEDIKKLLKKMIKQRVESIDIYKKNNRQDLLEVEQK